MATITRLHVNGLNYDLVSEPGGKSAAYQRMNDGMRRSEQFGMPVRSRQGDGQIHLAIKPDAVFAWAIYEWDTEGHASGMSPDWSEWPEQLRPSL